MTLDFADNRSLQCVRVMQGDKTAGRVIRISLKNNGEDVALDTNTDTATLWASVDNCITVEDAGCLISDNQVYIYVMGGMTAIPGTEHCTVKIESANGVVHTAMFDILVAPNPVSDDMPEHISTASLVERMAQAEIDIDSLETITRGLISNLASYIKYTLSGMFRGWKRTDRMVTGTELYGSRPYSNVAYYVIEKEYFNPDNGDGLMVWRNTTELIPPALYHFNVSDDEVTIVFHTEDDYFASTDRVYFAFYKKPASSGGGVIGTSMHITSAVRGEVVGVRESIQNTNSED